MAKLCITLDDEVLVALHLHPHSYVKGTVGDERGAYQDVAIHLNGNYGTFQLLEGKPSVTFNFDKFAREQKFHGMDKLHLNNSMSDPSLNAAAATRYAYTHVARLLTQAIW